MGRSPGVEMGGGGTKGGGGENGGDPGQGRPVTGPHRFRLLAKLKIIENQLFRIYHQNQNESRQESSGINRKPYGSE